MLDGVSCCRELVASLGPPAVLAQQNRERERETERDMYIYIYIEREGEGEKEREREREKEKENKQKERGRERERPPLYTCVYIYIYLKCLSIERPYLLQIKFERSVNVLGMHLLNAPRILVLTDTSDCVLCFTYVRKLDFGQA